MRRTRRRRRRASGSSVPLCRGNATRTVSRRVSKKAWVRNRIKRWIREAFRRLRGTSEGYDLLVIARPRATNATFADIRTELTTVLSKRLRLPGIDAASPPAGS